jgi:hypothetical protein
MAAMMLIIDGMACLSKGFNGSGSSHNADAPTSLSKIAREMDTIYHVLRLVTSRMADEYDG